MALPSSIMILWTALIYSLISTKIYALSYDDYTDGPGGDDPFWTVTYSSFDEEALTTTILSTTLGTDDLGDNTNARENDYGKCGVRGPSSKIVTKEANDIGPELKTQTEIYDVTTDIYEYTDEVVWSTQPSEYSVNPKFFTKKGENKADAALSEAIDEESIDQGAAVESSEWHVPTLNDTLFAQYTKKPTPLIPRITFGQVAGNQEFPWQVAMTVRGKFHCGGSLISDSHVLTAAHCVLPFENSLSLIHLSLGDWDLKKTNDGSSIHAKVSSAVIHPEFSYQTLQNDIAILKLTQKVTFTDRIRPICLPNSEFDLKEEEVIVTGWGKNEASKLQSKLHLLTAKVVSTHQCDRRWSTQGASKGFIVNSMMCMDATNGDSCNGDSGGPSVYEHPSGSGNYVQVGIVSFGSSSCNEPDLPGVYTKVSYYQKWISKKLSQ
ncbi:Tryptase gamma [Halocaridina rubra]|uniref:limulus clotting factor C n=1 Tax=Halocaridina rubra TaxID=373956 RepID=A0AAN9A2V3_HALRR